MLPHGMREWNPRVTCCRTGDFRSRDGACRGLARRRQAPPLALTPGADRGPGLPALASSRTSSHATCPIASGFSCRLRSNRPLPEPFRVIGHTRRFSDHTLHLPSREVGCSPKPTPIRHVRTHHSRSITTGPGPAPQRICFRQNSRHIEPTPARCYSLRPRSMSPV